MITVHADSEFRAQELFAWLVAQGRAAFLGLRGTTTPDGTLTALRERVRPDNGIVYFNLYAWWSKDDRGDPTRRVLVPTSAQFRASAAAGCVLYVTMM